MVPPIFLYHKTLNPYTLSFPSLYTLPGRGLAGWKASARDSEQKTTAPLG